MKRKLWQMPTDIAAMNYEDAVAEDRRMRTGEEFENLVQARDLAQQALDDFTKRLEFLTRRQIECLQEKGPNG